MSAAIPTIEPQSIVAGDTVKWTKSIADYLASDGWTLHYFLTNATDKIQIDCSASGDDHAVNVLAETSAEYAAGEFRYTAYVTKAAERYTVGEGVITVKANLSASTEAVDARSQTKRTLDAIDALIEGRAVSDVEQYTIGGRQVIKMKVKELLQWRAVYKAKYDGERRAAGEKVPRRTLGVRF